MNQGLLMSMDQEVLARYFTIHAHVHEQLVGVKKQYEWYEIIRGDGVWHLCIDEW